VSYLFTWLAGLLSGAAFSGAVLAAWLQKNPERLGLVVRWIVEVLSKHNGGTYIKMYVSLFDTRRASKVMAYVKPEDVAEAIGRYAVKPACIPLKTYPGMPNDSRESDEDASPRS
jgi:hypothetical protein